MTIRILTGDCRALLKTLPDASVNCCVTSPPYFGLRDYGVEGQIGLEETPEAYVTDLVAVFREVRRALRDDGTLWLNIGDTYSAGGRGHDSPKQRTNKGSGIGTVSQPWRVEGFSPKQLLGVPWRVAFALQADGWTLRQDIIWSKPNPMPESVRDRCTKAHEYLFLLSKSQTYYFDAKAIAEPALQPIGEPKLTGQHKADAGGFTTNGTGKSSLGSNQGRSTRNKRSVWAVPTQPFAEAHFATFPPALVEPCILAGCPAGGSVLDPFFGAGTTGLVANRWNLDCVGIELNPEYVAIAEQRLRDDAGMFAEVQAA